MPMYEALRTWPTLCRHNINTDIRDPCDHTEAASPRTLVKMRLVDRFQFPVFLTAGICISDLHRTRVSELESSQKRGPHMVVDEI